MKKKLIYSLGVSIAMLGAVGAILGTYDLVSADGGGGASSGAGLCGGSGRRLYAVCNADGWTWVRYRFDQSSAPSSFTFPGSDKIGESTIMGCSKGFWHIGYFIMKSAETLSADADGWYDRGGVYFKYGGSSTEGQIGNRTHGYVTTPELHEGSANGKGLWSKSELGTVAGFRVLISDSASITAQEYGDDSDVRSDFNFAVSKYNMQKYNESGDPETNADGSPRYLTAADYDDVAWFCYDPTDRETTYSAKTEASINGTSTAVNSGATIHNNSASVFFRHTITRNDDGTDESDREYFYVNESHTADNMYGDYDHWTYDDFDKNTSKYKDATMTVPVAPGQTVTAWETIHYEAGSNATIPEKLVDNPAITCTLNGASIAGRYCVYITRPNAYFLGSVTAEVRENVTGSSYAAKGNNTTTDIHAALGYVKFINTITRTDDSTTGAGGTATTSWQTEVVGNTLADSEKRAKTTATNTSELYSTDAAADKIRSEVVKYYDSSTTGISVELLPGQTKTLTDNLYYRGNSSATSDSTASRTINVHRPPATFTGAVTLRVGRDGSHLSEVTGTESNPYVYDTSADQGHVTLSFSDTITRTDTNSNTTAGDTATSKWKAQVRDHMGTRTGTNDDGAVSLGWNSNKSSVVKTYDNFSYDLDYGESFVVCGVLSYQNTINHDLYGTEYPVTTTRNCVKLTRGPETPPPDPDPDRISTCNDGASSTNQLLLGDSPSVNGGRIGIFNDTTGANAFTAGGRSLFDQTATSTSISAVSIWARPGDTVHFEAIGCASAQYKQYVYSQHYSHADHQVTIPNVNYTITGSSDSSNHGNASASERNSKYNFGTEISFNNSDASKFVGGRNVKKGLGYDALWSNPSVGSTNSYGCSPDTGTSPTFGGSGHYQVSGKIAYNDDGSISYPCSGTSTLDVGSTFSNTLNFTGLRVRGVKKVSGGATSEDIIIDEVDTGEDVSRFSYDLVYDSLGTFQAKANVKVPYNYKLKPYISKSGHATTSDPDNGVVFSGSTINFNAGIAVASRKNAVFGSSSDLNTYATITKRTTVQTRYYISSGSSTTYYNADGASKGSDSSWTTVLSGKRFNSGGNLAGMYDNTSYLAGGANISSTIPNKFKIKIPRNTAIGAKVCMQVRAYPADSHDSYISETVSGAGTQKPDGTYPALSETGSSDTSHSTTTACYTVAKKPSFSAEGSNAYSGGEEGFVTSVTNRTYFSNGVAGATYKYGSWSEYGVYGNVATTDLRGMASGATYAYNTGNSGQSDENLGRSTTSHVSTTENTNFCTLSTQTYTNDKCASGEVGLQGMGKNSATQYRDRVVSRFTAGNAQAISESEIWASRSGGTCPTNVSDPHSESSKPTCFTAGGTNYVYMSKFNGGARIANRDANGTSHVVVNQGIPVYIGSGNSSTMTYYLDQNLENSDERNFTYVYQVGTLVIDGNMYMGNYNGGINSDKDPILYNPNQMRQNIIVAKKVLITGRVNHIDATIIADEVDTCAYDTYQDFKDGKRVAVNATSGQKQLNSDSCSEPLTITAPVIAKKIIMHRTYGGGYDGNSYDNNDEVKRGEIYYLRPDLYLWSYSQMQRYSQAVTVNSRELPTRY